MSSSRGQRVLRTPNCSGEPTAEKGRFLRGRYERCTHLVPAVNVRWQKGGRLREEQGCNARYIPAATDLRRWYSPLRPG